MNRRTLLKSAFGLVASIPFMALGEKEPIILGVDKAAPGTDETFYTILDLKNIKVLPLKDYSEFEGVLPVEEYARRMGIFLPSSETIKEMRRCSSPETVKKIRRYYAK